jgi:DNA-binding FadR family transcriptional regulator
VSDSRSIHPPKTAELIAEAIRGDIIDGRLEDGHPLTSEAELVDRFAVSRPTMREALRILEAESLLSIRRGGRGGARVVAPSERSAARYVGRYLQFQKVPLADVHEARCGIELAAVIRLTEHRTAEDLETLRAAVARGEGKTLDATVEELLSGGSFHRLIVELAGNRTNGIFYGILEEVMLATAQVDGRLYQPEVASENVQAHKVHVQLVDLIDERDLVGAEELWRKHLRAKVRVFPQFGLGGNTVRVG